MGTGSLKLLMAVGMGVLLVLPAAMHAQAPGAIGPAEVRPAPSAQEVPSATDVPSAEPSDAVPPWGRALGQPGSVEIAAPDPATSGACAPRIWLTVEYLLWWTRNGSAPPLITRGESSDTLPGALDQQFTKILYGGSANDINFQDRHGGRFTFGMPLDADGDRTIEASYLFLTARAVGTNVASPGSPILAQPFYNVLTGSYDSSLATFPGLIEGSISVRSSSFLQGAEVNGTAILWQRDQNRIALLAGLRWLDLHEDLQITGYSTGVADAPMFAGSVFAVQDRFVTWSDFYGAQIGLSTEWHWRRLQLNLVGKIALGDTHEASRIAGATLTSFPAPLSAPAGFLALASNSGSFARHNLGFVPEAGVNLGFRITDRLTICAGYTFLYWSQVARPGSQIDIALNPNLIPTSLTYGTPGGPARPSPAIRGSDWWAQGVTAGLIFRY
jgi:hypothetical protein